MAVRIALQCDSSDAMLILSEDNTAAGRLRHSGQAIYNEAGGRIESNQNFQVAFLEKNDQVRRLEQLQDAPIPQTPTINALGRRIVFEGHKPARWDSSSVRFAFQSQPKLDPGSTVWVLGDSVSIDPPVLKTLTRTAGRNVMVVGQDEQTTAATLAGLFAGWKLTHSQSSEPNTDPRFFLLDGTRNEDTQLRHLIQFVSNSSVPCRVGGPRDVDTMVATLGQELEKRMQSPDEDHPTLYLAVLNLARFRELRRSEEFSYSMDANAGVKTDETFAKLLSDGPMVGIHVWLWADSAGTLSRWLSRQSIRDIEIRVLMQMSASDSNQLIDSNIANRMDKHVVLVHDDVEGKSIKFRQFELESVLESLNTPMDGEKSLAIKS
jgi:hypothetical protein